MYSLYVYDKSRVRIGVVEDIDSLQWLSPYAEAGEVKLVCAATEKNIALLQDGCRLWCTEQKESAVIRECTIDDTGEDAKCTVRAVHSVARWADRVIMATENIRNVESGMLSLVNKNRRGLCGATAPAKGLTAVTETQTTWGSVLDAQETLAAAHDLGFRETFAPETGVDTFEVYKGTDRTQGDYYNGYFGNDAENISSAQIVRGTADWKNTAIVGGEGEGAARKIVVVSIGNYTGDDLRELWADAKDITRKYQISTPDGSGGYTYTEATYTDAEYTAILTARGLEKLAEHLQTLEVDAVLADGLLVYGKDYFLGDIIPIKLTKYGLQITARVSAVRTVYESTGRLITAVLSDFSIKGGA